MINRLWIALLVSVVCIRATDAANSFGRTPGQFGVSATGSVQYSIPIWTPPGPRGMQPNLALTYNSGSGIGTMGIGWSLSGLGAITRCNLTYAQDGTPAAVALATTDGYCLNGNRLRLTSGTYGTSGSTYQTEIADFSNVTANGTAGNGPQYFTVQGKNGLKYMYGYVDANGNGVNSEVIATGTSTASTWLLSKVIDRSGNNWVINYSTLTGTAVPNTIYWTPTSAGASTYTYTMQFNYGANVPQSSINKSVAGTAVANADLLSSVSVSAGSTVLRDYFLSYQAAPTTGRDELYTVQECADSAQSNCLRAITVGYQNGTAGVASPATATGSGTTTGTVFTADIDGDGKQDLVFAVASGSNYQWWVQFATASGFTAPVNTGAVTASAQILLDDFDGKSGNEILAANGSIWYLFKWNGTSFTSTSTGATVIAGVEYASADVDGDGLPDLINVGQSGSNGTLNWGIQLNTGAGSGVSFAATPVTTVLTVDTSALTSFRIYGNNQLQNSPVHSFDFDGDGRQDLLLKYLINNGNNIIYKAVAFASRGTGAPVFQTGMATEDTTPGDLLAVNWNDDACTDLVFDTQVWIAQCNGNIAAGVTLPAAPQLAVDWDGDGRTDVLVNVGGVWQVYQSEGSGVAAPASTGISVGSGNWLVMDQNGDGLSDLVYSNSAANYALYYGLHNGAGQPPDLATSFTDGYGVSYAPSYVALAAATSSVYAKGTSQVFPQQDYDGSIYVTSSALYPDGLGSTYSKSYAYTGAVKNLQGRGLQGFTTFSTLDSRNNLTDTRTYSTGYLSSGSIVPTAGTLIAESVTQSGGINVSVGQYTLSLLTLNSTAYNERYFSYLSASSVNNYEVQIGGSYNGQLITTTATNYGTPDSYGNFDTVVTTVTDEDSGSPYYNQSWSTTTASTIAPNISTWCLSLPTEVDVTNTAPGVPNITRHRTFLSPDYTNCRETEQVVESGNATYQVTDVYGFDAFGNTSSQTVTGIGMAARISGITFGTTGQFPAKSTNALNQITQFSFDPNVGTLQSVTDPNGLITYWQYDPFQRKTTEIRPDGTYTLWEYQDCASWGGCLYGQHALALAHWFYSNKGGALSAGTNWLDQFDRTVIANTSNIAGKYDRTEQRYDNLGNIAQQAMPCVMGANLLTLCPYWATFTHDPLNRLTQTQRPISSTNSTLQTSTIKYSGRTALTTDPQGKTTTTVVKVTGSLGRTQDNNGYAVNFGHDAFGSVLSVTDSLSNTLRSTTYAYGLNAFETALTDMDLGTRSYTHDALGELTAYSDGLAQNFSVAYDALSRVTKRTDPDLTTTWTWGNSASSYNIGKLASVSSVATAGTYTDSYSFDTTGRLSDETITMPGGGSYSFDYAYSATTGLLSTLTYPKSASPSTYRLTVGYSYYYNFLTKIFDNNTPSTIWWQANTINPRQQITQETTGDSSSDPQIVVNHTFDAVTGWLSSNQAGVGSGYALQNESYTYDYMGNVTQRQNNNLGLTENFYYDNLYRLYNSTLNGTTNLQMCYDNTGGACTENLVGMGNITSRSDIASGAAWTYDPSRKHAVTQAGSSAYTYTYNANGNATSRNGSTISWTSYNYPSGVGTSTESATFDYGPNRQRWRMIYSGSSGNETTYYASPLFEQVVTSSGSDFRHYIYAGGRPVLAISRTTAGAINVHSLLVDQQGSISSIVTDATGVSDVSESFTAFGNRREASTWSGSPTSAELNTMNGVTREGYTFQTVLGSMGLNHMNGRIEDAVTGRFLSPDPHTTNRFNTQAYNRYGYVKNNPLTRIDPSGFVDENPPVAPPCVPNDNCLDEIPVTGQRDPSPAPDPQPAAGVIISNSAGNTLGTLETIVVTAHRPPKVTPTPFVPPPITFDLDIQPPTYIDIPDELEEITVTARRPKSTTCPQGGLADAMRAIQQGAKSTAKFGTNLAKGGSLLLLVAAMSAEVPPVGVAAGMAGAAGIFGGGIVILTADLVNVAAGIVLLEMGDSQPLAAAGYQAGVDGVNAATDAPTLPLGIPDPSDTTEQAVGLDPCP